MKDILALASLLVLVAACGAGEPEPGDVPIADTVFNNGRIFTIDPSQVWVEAVAVKNGRYSYVGDADGLTRHIGETTTVIDLGGKMAMPGINETHAHSWQGGTKALYECNFPFTASPGEIAVIVTACVESSPDSAWITGGQWTSSFFADNDIGSPREWLDQYSGDKAIYFEDDATHNAWVNSRALKLAGINRNTPDPEGGSFVRDSNGDPNGLVFETAKPIVEQAIPDMTHAQNVAAIAEAVRLANSYGLTGIHEARTPPEVSPAYRQLDQEGRLTAYAITNMQTPRGQRSDPFDVTELEAVAEEYASTHVYTKFAKFFLDGVPTVSRSGLMIEPYVVNEEYPEATRGHSLITQSTLIADLIELDRRGFTAKMHAAGDGSVRLALDAIEEVRKTNGPSGLRHEIAHAGYIHPEDLSRFAELNVTADLSPYLWFPRPIINSIVEAVGDRALYYWPIKDLIESGANVAAGSDWPSVAESMNPWPAIEALVTRRNPYTNGDEALWPEQAITLDQALKIFTLDGALAYRLEHLTGSIELDKSADLIVLNQDLFDVPIESVSDTRVEQTYFEGKLVFSAED
ncbi:MAG: amidohydrolase [Woeseiaceae bacterium]